MKVLKKINKGVLLSILVLIILITYIIIVEVRRIGEKDQIKEVCTKYIEFENKYSVMPNEYWSNKESINKDDYKKEMANALKEIMIDNEKIYNQQKNIVEDKLEESLLDYNILVKKESKKLNFKSFNFDSDQVEVVIENVLEKETKIIPMDEPININEAVSDNKSEKYDDIITLKRENGVWKVVFADIESTLSENNRFF